MGRKQYRVALFFSHVTGREERYLEKKARQGWHLRRALFGMIYTFEQGEPEDVVYKMDFHHTPPGELEAYTALYGDLGWTYVCRYHEWFQDCWHYFKTPRTGENGEPELYTDTESQILHYRSYIRFLSWFTVVFTGGMLVLDTVLWLVLRADIARFVVMALLHCLCIPVAIGLLIRHMKKRIKALEERRL